MGRNKFVIDYEKVFELASIMCTQQEIASVLKCHRETLIKDEKFQEIYNQGLDNGRMSLRRRQFNMSETNPAMAIWLGKQMLNQKDQVENNVAGLDKLDEILKGIKDNAIKQ